MTAWMWFWSISVFGALVVTGGVSLITIIGGFGELRDIIRTKSLSGETPPVQE